MRKRRGFLCLSTRNFPLTLVFLLTFLWPRSAHGITAGGSGGGNSNFVHNNINGNNKGGNRFFVDEVIGSREKGSRYNRDGSSVSDETGTNALTRSRTFADFDNNARNDMGDGTYFSSQYGSFQRQQQQPSVQHPQEVNPLLKKASEGSVGLLFLLLTWRSLSTYEMAGEDRKYI